jgi:hypothetical protein
MMLAWRACELALAQPPAPPPAGFIVALRSRTDLPTGQTFAAFLDVIDPDSGTVAYSVSVPNNATNGGGAGAGSAGAATTLTLRRSTVEGSLARSDDGCSVALAGYAAPVGTANAYRLASVARSAAVYFASGELNVSTGDLTLAAVQGQARSVALFAVPGLAGGADDDDGGLGPGTPVGGNASMNNAVVFGSDWGVTLPALLGTVRNETDPVDRYYDLMLAYSNVRGLLSRRNRLYVSSASNVAPITQGIWLLNPAGGHLSAPLPSLGEFIADVEAPYGFAFLDDFTILVASEVEGLVLLRSNQTVTRGGEGWFRTANVLSPEGFTFTHVGVDTSRGHALSDVRAFAVTSGPDSEDLATTIYEVLVSSDFAALTLRAVVASPKDFEYRGVAGAPHCVPIPLATPFPLPSASPSPTPSSTATSTATSTSTASASPSAAAAAAAATAAGNPPLVAAGVGGAVAVAVAVGVAALWARERMRRSAGSRNRANTAVLGSVYHEVSA